MGRKIPEAVFYRNRRGIRIVQVRVWIGLTVSGLNLCTNTRSRRGTTALIDLKDTCEAYKPVNNIVIFMPWDIPWSSKVVDE